MGRQLASDKLDKHLATRVDRERLEARGTLKEREDVEAQSAARAEVKDLIEKNLQTKLETGNENPWARVDAAQEGDTSIAGAPLPLPYTGPSVCPVLQRTRT